MDEVEPALDDVNLHRFLRLVEGFAQRSQVLIVTHQKRTMETAGMMYGVSMGTDGTSKVICQRLEGSDPPVTSAETAPSETQERDTAVAEGSAASVDVPDAEPVH